MSGARVCLRGCAGGPCELAKKTSPKGEQREAFYEPRGNDCLNPTPDRCWLTVDEEIQIGWRKAGKGPAIALVPVDPIEEARAGAVQGFAGVLAVLK